MNFFINFLELIGALVFCFFVLTSLGRFFLHICLTKEKNQIDVTDTLVGLSFCIGLLEFLRIFIPIDWKINLFLICFSIIYLYFFDQIAWIKLLHSFNQFLHILRTLFWLFVFISFCLLALADPNNYDDWINKIQLLNSDKILYKNISINALDTAKKFTWSNRSRKVIKLYNKCMSK